MAAEELVLLVAVTACAALAGCYYPWLALFLAFGMHLLHKVFFDYCGNRFLKETYKRYNRIRSLLISSAMRASRNRQPSVDQHRQITAAFEAGQFDLARERMREHYQYGVHLLLDRENHA